MPGPRRTAAAVILAAALTLSPLGSSARGRHHLQDHPRVLACHSILLPDRRDKARIERFIRCAGTVWKAPGSPAYWVSIARCESGLYWRSRNPNGHVGIYQHDEGAWPARVSRYIAPLELHNRNWWNPEANVIVAMRMTHATGTWTPAWSCG